MAPITRRDFLKSAGVLGLSLTHLRWLGTSQAWAAGSPLPGQHFKSWEDLYRQQWTWDKVSRNTHFVNCWYQAACNWNIYVKDGIVWREEQAGVYPQINPEVPDLNPRGCQKGACYSERMYDPTRVKYPLKRVGKRGEGKWQRISWDQALTEIADEFINTLTKEGPAAFEWDMGTHASYGSQSVGYLRLAKLLDTPIWEIIPEVGDEHQGAAVTTGKVCYCSSLDDMFQASMLLLWGGNPIVTQIPNAHFFPEARYNGTKIVTISPDYSASAVHSDLWVPIKVGSDPALALGLSQVIVSERLYNAAFLKEQTDMALLVRDDTRLFLRESDMKEGGADDRFYAWDTASKKIRMMPQRTLALGDIDPALEGEYEVTTAKGRIKVRPVFELFKERLEEYTPEKASKACGASADTIRNLARSIAKAKAVTTVTNSNFSKFYDSIENERGQILVLALCGHFGRKGAGHQAFPNISADALQEAFAYPSMPLPEGKKVFHEKMAGWVKSLKDKGYTDEMISYEIAHEAFTHRALVSSVLQLYYHGGSKELMKDQRKWDPSMKRDLDEYLKLSLEKGWQFAYPDVTPRVHISEGGNLFRRFRGYPKLLEVFLPKLRLLIDVNWRMSNTGRHADYILPCASYYERDDTRYVTPLPFAYLHGAERAVDPFGEAHQEWTIHCLLAKKIQERAIKRGVTHFKDREGKERRLDNVYDELTYAGHYKEYDTVKLARDFVKVSTNLEGNSWDELAKNGFVRFTSVGDAHVNIGNATDLRPNEPVTPNTWHVQKKIPWPTLTRRIQFYLDQELFIELGEELPVYKEEHIGGNYPLRMAGGHTRHSIHTAWRDDSLMLRLQRGEPELYINVHDARERGIEDHELVRVYNDVGVFEVRAKVSPSCAPGEVIMYHAWEPYMFKGEYSHQTLTPSPINPVELAGGYFHLRPMLFSCSPGQSDRGVRVEVEKLDKSGPRLGLRV